MHEWERMGRADYRYGAARGRNRRFARASGDRRLAWVLVHSRADEAAARLFCDRRPGRPEISYRTAMMQDEKKERRRRARNVAWIVGFGLLGLNILIGVPTCLGTGEGTGSDDKADVAGPASAPAGDGSAASGDRSD